MPAPRATYRVQLSAAFGFDAAAALVPSLARLGVSHLHASPCLAATQGSTHGYDVTDPRRLDPDRGGEPAFRRLLDALRRHDLGLLLDIVPNHMAASPGNPWWWDVLERGPASPWARVFDLVWGEGAAGPTVLLPVLPDHYGRVLEAGGLRLVRRGRRVVVSCGGLELPLAARSRARLAGAPRPARAPAVHGERLPAELAAGAEAGPEPEPELEPPATGGERELDARLAAVNADPERLDAVLRAQHYRLAWWRLADQQSGYRRFLTVSSLVGVRVEDADVFRLTHGFVLSLLDPATDGLRVDHVDGLRDPAGYLDRLHAASGGAWTVVEKVLAPGERLPTTWPVAGTTGYDFLQRVNTLYVDPQGADELTACYQRFTGERHAWAEIAREGRRTVLEEDLGAEFERLAAQLEALLARRRRHADHGRRTVRRALAAVLVALPVYRVEVRPGGEPSRDDGARVAEALATARAHEPDLDAELLDLLGRLVLLEEPGAAEMEFGLRVAQLTGPLAAKGLEDLAFYRYNRLASLAEVGCDPGVFGGTVEEFHAAMEAAARDSPQALLALSTHDTKRSGDVRARISLLAEVPAAWSRTVEALAAAARGRGESPDVELEYLLYQTLVGTWPLEPPRLLAFLVKAAREARRGTSWHAPDAAHERALQDFARRALLEPVFVDVLEDFLLRTRLVEHARLSSLAQTALLLTCPGVPDLHEGTERWRESLVDPDNRRPVDHAPTARLLLADAAGPPGVELADDAVGEWKLWLVRRLLAARAADDGPRDYEPLAATGERARHAVAFRCGRLVTVVPRFVLALGGGWSDTSVHLPAGAWTDVLSGARWSGGRVRLRELLGLMPLAVLRSEPR